jgi:CRP-like cAMP-binding protein
LIQNIDNDNTFSCSNIIIKVNNEMEPTMYVTSPTSFSHIDSIQAKVLLKSNTLIHTPIKTIRAGSPVFHEGDESRCVYEVLEGVVRSSKNLRDGRRQILAFGYPGDLIGVSHNCKYNSDCDALSDVKLRVYRSNACSTDPTSDPKFCDHLLKSVTAEMAGMQEHFMMLGKKSAMEKLASFLIVLLDRSSVSQAQKNIIEFPMSRMDIADFLGLTVETVSRGFAKLRRDKMINLPKPQTVEILKPNCLREMGEVNEQ